MLFLVSSVLAGAPVAEAGLGVMAYVGDTVILEGSGSTDPDGDPLTWQWTQTSGPPVTLTNADTMEPGFDVTDPGTLRFQLIVGDGTAFSAADEVAVVVPDKDARPLGDEAKGCHTGSGNTFGLGAVVFGVGLLRRRQR